MAITRALSIGDGPNATSRHLNDRARHYVAWGTWNAATPGVVTCDLWIVGADADERQRNREALLALLARAAEVAAGAAGPWVTLAVAEHTSDVRYYDVTGGTLPPGTLYDAGRCERATLTLSCLPRLRGATLRVENLLLNSEDFSGWTLTSVTVNANALAAPDGSLTADRIVEVATTGGHAVRQDATTVVGQVYTCSVWAKAAERTRLRIALLDGAGANVSVHDADLAAGTLTAVTAGDGAGIEDAGDGWYRLWVTGSATSATSRFVVSLLNASGGASYPGNAANGLSLWGAQLERASAAGLYLATGSSAVLVGANASVRVYGVPGSEDALVRLTLTDVSPLGVINRVRAGRRHGDALTGLVPLLDATAISPATNPASAGAVGGTVAERSTTSQAPVDLARVLGPGTQRGPLDVWGRVWSQGMTLDQPGTPAGTLSAPASETLTTYGTIQRAKTRTATLAAGTTARTLGTTWGAATATGSFWVAILKWENTTATEPLVTITGAPAGWGFIEQISTGTGIDKVTEALYVRENAPSVNGTTAQNWTLTPGVAAGYTADLLMLEFTGVPTSNVIDAYALQAFAGNPQFNLAARFDNSLFLAVVADSSQSSGLASLWMGGAVEFLDANGLIAGEATLAAGGSLDLTIVKPGGTPATGAALVLNAQVTTSAGAALEPFPGALQPGGYLARVVAIDQANARSNASSSSSTVTVTIAGSAIEWTWTGVSGAVSYELVIQYGGRCYRVLVSGTVTSYLLTTLAGLEQVSGLPAISGAVAPGPRLEVRLGTAGGGVTAIEDVALDGAGEWRMVPLSAGRQHPPVAALLDESRPDWLLEVAESSANGRSATVRFDALWAVPHDEPQLEAWVSGLALATKRSWLLETDRRGTHMNGWLRDSTTGAEVGRVRAPRPFTLAPGDNLVMLAFEQAGGLWDLANAQMTLELAITPRWGWTRGKAGAGE